MGYILSPSLLPGLGFHPGMGVGVPKFWNGGRGRKPFLHDEVRPPWACLPEFKSPKEVALHPGSHGRQQSLLLARVVGRAPGPVTREQTSAVTSHTHGELPERSPLFPGGPTLPS